MNPLELRAPRAAAFSAALAQIRVLPAPAAAATAAGQRFFDPADTELLTLIVERMVETGDPAAPRVRDTGTVACIDAACGQLDPAVSGQIPLALWLFEYAPLFFELSFERFSRMSDAERDASLRAWMTSRLAIRRLAFTALRNLSMLGYYSQPETWPLIGYRGPLLSRGAAS